MSCCYLVELFTKLIFSDHESKHILSDTRFYYLTLKRSKHTEAWSIHGLWPQYSSNSYPRYCRDIPFNYDKLEPIYEELKQFWYSDKETDEDFWKHEWDKHGTCMFNNCDEFSYFKKALSLYVEVLQSNLVNNYREKEFDTELKIPFDINFNLLPANINY